MKSNINPKFINVAIAGRVENPGQLRLNKTATLNEAIIFSGGLKDIKMMEKLIEENSDIPDMQSQDHIKTHSSIMEISLLYQKVH